LQCKYLVTDTGDPIEHVPIPAQKRTVEKYVSMTAEDQTSRFILWINYTEVLSMSLR
jgi:hypothetical protein